MKYAIALLTLFAALSCTHAGDFVQVGQKVPTYKLPDQHGKIVSADRETKAVVICYAMDQSKMLNTWMSDAGKDLLAENHVHYISDISPMPAPITKMFALPKMQKYNFQIILNRNDDFKKRYPNREGYLTVLKLEDKKVTAIDFVKTLAELKEKLGLETR